MLLLVMVLVLREVPLLLHFQILLPLQAQMAYTSQIMASYQDLGDWSRPHIVCTQRTRALRGGAECQQVFEGGRCQAS